MSMVDEMADKPGAPSRFAYTSVRNPRWAKPGHGGIDCEVLFPAIDPEPLPFTAHPGDTEPHGREIYERCLRGDFGPIAGG